MCRTVLENLRVVLVEPSHPGNVGAAARAMKTMGLSRLYLVKPNRYPSAEATARASGADDLLHAAKIVDSLTEAVDECALVVGTSARERELEWPQLTPRESADRLVEAAAMAPGALVFGRERSGLTNRELELCHYLVRIPTNPVYSSLNIAAAVQILAYELRLAAADSTMVEGDRSKQWIPAGVADVEGLMRHLEEALVEIGFLDPNQPKRLMSRLWRLCNRAQPDRTEINILRGILKAVKEKSSL